MAQPANQGIVYIYDSKFPYNLLTTVTAPDAVDNDNFGSSVSIQDYTLAIGADSQDDNGDGAGKVYIYSPSGSAYILNQTIVKDPGTDLDNFGYGLSVSGNTLAVGGVFSRSGDDKGSVLIYRRVTSMSDFILAETIDDTAGDFGDRFGDSISLTSEYMAVGSPGFGIDVGKVLVYNMEAGSPVVTHTISAPDGAILGQMFGSSVDIEGSTLFVGAKGYTLNAVTESGIVYKFQLNSDGTHTLEDSITRGTFDKTGIGSAVRATTDNLLIGGSISDVDAEDAGEVFVYSYAETDYKDALDAIERADLGQSKIGLTTI